MKGSVITNVKCDYCGKQFFGCRDANVNLKLARKWLKHAGWVSIRHSKGKILDVCPTCQAKPENERVKEVVDE